MQNRKWLTALIGVTAILAFGLIAAGCGDDEDTTSTAAESATTTEATDTTEDETTAEDTDSESASPDDIYNACIDVISGTPAEAQGQVACEQARDAFEQCAEQAEDSGSDAAVQACQEAADQTVEGLKAAG